MSFGIQTFTVVPFLRLFIKIIFFDVRIYLAPSTEAVSFAAPPPPQLPLPATPEAPDEDKDVAEPLAELCTGPMADLGLLSPPDMVVIQTSEDGVWRSLNLLSKFRRVRASSYFFLQYNISFLLCCFGMYEIGELVVIGCLSDVSMCKS